MADRDVEYKFTGNTTSLKKATDEASKLLGNVAKAESSLVKNTAGTLGASMSKILAPIKAVASGFTGIVSQMKQVISQSLNIRNAFNSINSVLQALTGVALGDVFSKATQSSVDFIETLNLFQVATKNSIEAATEFVGAMQNIYGLDPKSVMDSVGYFYQLTSAMEMPIAASEKVSLGLTKLSTDIASLFNADIEVVTKNMSAGMQGLSRSVTKYGIDIRRATLQEYASSLGIKQKVAVMSEASRQALRYIIMIKQTKNAQGDWAKTIESVANQLRIFREQIQQLSRAIGNIVLGPLERIIPVVNGIVMAMRIALTYINAFVRFFKPTSFNSTGKAASGAADAIDDVGTAAAGAGGSAKKAAKEAKKAVAAFDQINYISDPSKDSSSGGSGGGGGVGGIDPAILAELDKINLQMDNVKMKADKTKAALLEFFGFSSKSGDFNIEFNYDTQQWETDIKYSAEQFKANLIDKFPQWKKTIDSIFTNWGPISTSFDNVMSSLSNLFSAGLSPLKALFSTLFNDESMSVFFTDLSSNMDNLATGINWVANLFNPWKSTFESLGVLIKDTIGYLGAKFVELGPSIAAFNAQLAPAVKRLIEFANPVIANVIDHIGNILKMIGEEVLPILVPLFENIGKAVMQLVTDAMPMLENGFTVLTDLLKILEPVLGAALVVAFAAVEAAMSIMNTTFKIAIDLYKRFKPFVDALITAIATIALGFGIYNVAMVLYNVTMGIATGVTGAFTAVMAVLTSPITLVVAAIAAVIAVVVLLWKNWSKIGPALGTSWARLANSAKKIFGDVGLFIKGVFDSVVGSIKELTNTSIRNFNKLIGGLNKVHVDVPDWVPVIGGKTFGFKIAPIKELAGGGMVNAGQMFIAREAGPELVGSSGGSSFVMNNDQIVESVSRGVARANEGVIKAINHNSSKNQTLVVDKRVLAQVVSEALADHGRSTGYALGVR